MIVEVLVLAVAGGAAYLFGTAKGKVDEQKAVAELLVLDGDAKSVLAAVEARVKTYLADVKAELKKL